MIFTVESVRCNHSVYIDKAIGSTRSITFAITPSGSQTPIIFSNGLRFPAYGKGKKGWEEIELILEPSKENVFWGVCCVRMVDEEEAKDHPTHKNFLCFNGELPLTDFEECWKAATTGAVPRSIEIDGFQRYRDRITTSYWWDHLKEPDLELSSVHFNHQGATTLERKIEAVGERLSTRIKSGAQVIGSISAASLVLLLIMLRHFY